jgi:tetratricopeptide (TPR) repeat protein
LDKALDIKRRAQRYIQSGDLDGALGEYERLVALPDCDPYNFVLLADLLFKRGEMPGAIDRYLSASTLYEKSGLYKNAIAVCKKMMRLSLAPAQVLEQLANLHALDGLPTEATLYYRQFAEHLVQEQRGADAAAALRKAFAASPEETALLEKAADALLLDGEQEAAAMAYAEAAAQYRQRGRNELAAECRAKAEKLYPGAWQKFSGETESTPGSAPPTRAAAGAPQDSAQVSVHEIELAANGGAPEADVGLSVTPPSLQGDPSRPHPPIAAAPAAKSALPGEVDALLKQAQEAMRAGDQESASRALLDAAAAYEANGRFDNAATIYRSIARTSKSPLAVLERWLANAERRDARNEAAEVACQLGDHALEMGDTNTAAEWFRHAVRLDENNATAQRRLKRLEPEPPPPAGPPLQVAIEAAAPPKLVQEPAPAPAAVPPRLPVPMAEAAAPVAMEPPAPVAEAPAPAAPKVELAVGRGEAVSFDLGSLLGEFQRGIEAQLSGDAQGHYDLAMAYREMGLLDLAIESFRLALTSPVLAPQATEMLGRSLLDQGRFDEAIDELSKGLGQVSGDDESVLGLRYLLGLAFEAAGRPREALAEFEYVFSRQASFQDVTQKVRDARKALGS